MQIFRRHIATPPTGTVIALAIVTLVAAIVTPNLLRSRIAANEASAVGSLRTISTAAETYRADHPAEGYPRNLSALAPYVDPNLASGLKSGYAIRYTAGRTDFDGAIKDFRVEAEPVVPGSAGQRSFSAREGGGIAYRASAAQAETPLNGETTQPSAGSARQRKIMRTGSLRLMVGDPEAATEQIRSVAARVDGYVDSVRYSDDGGGRRQTRIAIRVPAVRFDDARRAVRALADRVRDEEDDARDVTATYVDAQSNLRNFQAEEAQYLEIMRRSGTIKDTLAVAERLADVRGRIERTQAQLNLMAHETEMALLDVTLFTETIAQPVDVRWHPWPEMKAAYSQAASDLSAYANLMIAVVFRVPVFLLFAFTAALLTAGLWRLLRWTWRRVVPAPAA